MMPNPTMMIGTGAQLELGTIAPLQLWQKETEIQNDS
jgi:hypothetical protein